MGKNVTKFGKLSPPRCPDVSVCCIDDRNRRSNLANKVFLYAGPGSRHAKRPNNGPYSLTFWHLISRGYLDERIVKKANKTNVTSLFCLTKIIK